MNNDLRVPTPKQVHTWLLAHGWTPEEALIDPEEAVDYVHKDLSDDGHEILVRAPQIPGVPPWYPLLVRAVIVTAAGMEDRPEADVLAEMLAVTPAPAPEPPAVPVP